MKRAYFLLFTRPMMTQMNRKEANTSPMKACHTTQKPLRHACRQILLRMFLLVVICNKSLLACHVRCNFARYGCAGQSSFHSMRVRETAMQNNTKKAQQQQFPVISK